MRKFIIICVFILGSGFSAGAQETFANLNLSRKSVYPGEPFRLTVKTFTSTYFLSPITFEDFRVSNAFTITFSRTLSGITRVDGKQYATLEFFLQVYPIESGTLEIPPFKLSFQSPPEGDYKGRLQQIETNPAIITIKPIPENSPVKPWFVANRVTLSDNFQNSGSAYKVGDVIEREVIVKASGTMPNFIPELNFEESDGLEVYPRASHLLDKRNDEQAIGWKTQKVLYLLTKEGNISIPELEINWFNPLTSKSSVTRVNARTIPVLPNEDLGILETIKDSLNIAGAEIDASTPAADKPDYRKIIILAGLSLITLLLLWKVYKYAEKVRYRFIEKRNRYRQSPAWYYKQIFKNTHSTVRLVNSINHWWDRVRNGHQPVSISEALKGKPYLETWLNLQKLNKPPGNKDLKQLTAELYGMVKSDTMNAGYFAINPDSH